MKHLHSNAVSQIHKQMQFAAPRQWAQAELSFFSDTSLWVALFNANSGITTKTAVTLYSVVWAYPVRVLYTVSKLFSLVHFIYPEYFTCKAVSTGGREHPRRWGCGVSWQGTEPHQVLPSQAPAAFERGKVSVCTTSRAGEQHPVLAQDMLRGNLRMWLTDLSLVPFQRSAW